MVEYKVYILDGRKLISLNGVIFAELEQENKGHQSDKLPNKNPRRRGSLSPEQIEEFIEDCRFGEMSNKELAEKYTVSTQTVVNLKRRHVTHTTAFEPQEIVSPNPNVNMYECIKDKERFMSVLSLKESKCIKCGGKSLRKLKREQN